MTTRNWIVSVILAACLLCVYAFAAFGAGAQEAEETAKPAKEKVLRIRVAQTFANLLPQVAPGSSGLALIYDLLYSRTLQPNPNGFFEPDLAPFRDEGFG